VESGRAEGVAGGGARTDAAAPGRAGLPGSMVTATAG